jgi:hypothetical protein
MGARRGSRTGTSAAIGACLALLGMGLAPVSTSRALPATDSQTHCKSQLQGEPCKGPIRTLYSYTGLGSGDLSYIWAKPGPEVSLGRRLKTFPPPAYYAPVSKRTFTWHTKPSIEIVAVYVVRSLTRRYTYQKVASGLHSGQATLTTNNDDPNPPLLLLEGRKMGTGPPGSTTAGAMGSSCAHPLRSSEAVDGFPGQHSDTKDFSVHVKIVSETNPGERKPGAFMTLQLVVMIHNPRIELCRAAISAVTPDNQHISEHKVRISAHGGTSSTVTIPANYSFAGIAYARLR